MTILFFIGIIEMLIVTAWTRAVTRGHVLASGGITIVNIFVWYYVLKVVINDINNVWLVATYAFGCAVGCVIATTIFSPKKR